MIVEGVFPSTRMRRMRRDAFSRRLMRETTLSAADFIYPVFVLEGSGRSETVTSMPGVKVKSCSATRRRRGSSLAARPSW